VKRGPREPAARPAKPRRPGPLIVEAAPPAKAAASTGDAAVEMIVKVKTPGYVPPGISVRAQISPTLLTATVSPAARAQLEKDPEVISMATADRIQPAQSDRGTD
jgi:hypothetical protein